MKPSELISALNWRYATKEFDKEKALSKEETEALRQSLVLSPSSFGLQPWKFLQIEDKEILAELREVSWGQAQVTDADLFFVLAVKINIDEAAIDEWMQHLADERGVEVDSLAGYKGVLLGFVENMNIEQRIEWAKRQAYIALGQLMTSAAAIKVDTCPLEGIDPDKYDEILELEDKGLTTAVACAVGFRSANDKYQDIKKVRFNTEDLIEVL